MRDVIIEQTERFCFVSIGNGAAYTLTDKKFGHVRVVQYGDAATRFRENYENMQEAYTNADSVWHKRSWDECLFEVFCNS